MSFEADELNPQVGHTEKSLHEQQLLKDVAPDVPFLDVSTIEWPTVQYYGHEHHSKTAMLASHLGRFSGLEFDEVNALWCAGSFHDLYRTKPFGIEETHHHEFAADFVRDYLKGTDYWSNDAMIERCCWLIANQARKEHEYANNKIMMCLADAEKYEVCRINPGSPEGARLIKEHCHPDNLQTGFCKERKNLRLWMHFRGWK